MTSVLLACWLCSLTACSTPSPPVSLAPLMPALPAYPERPCLNWQGLGPRVALSLGDAVLLRDWLVAEQAWRESVVEVWGIYEKH